ncbi:M15 family metallopeptidase [Hydrogenibacillus sp. N12]|uniref:M15 family metallopeptidase n=1 Tax=Hydrogenibacillus sp. N12 TaxID=2866627 RepID=UPI001C7D92BB|nr:M15 family metallopeptidase [Hydrogenibacillus sp. N12]QZA32850.1 D-alanyl-D-alanine carboxypeptidase family protein [Hydrogenibacillus sp. N12]
MGRMAAVAVGALAVALAAAFVGLKFGFADGIGRSGSAVEPPGLGAGGAGAVAGGGAPAAPTPPRPGGSDAASGSEGPGAGRSEGSPSAPPESEAPDPAGSGTGAGGAGLSPAGAAGSGPSPAGGAGAADPFKVPAAVTEVADPLSLLVLVNKAHRLPPDFRPPDLVPVAIPFDKPEGDEGRLMRREAARAIEALVRAAEADGIRLIGVSAFRSYELQKQIFEANVRRKGEAEALKVSAPPGMSEHQTGLAIDVADRSRRCLLEPCFGASAAGRWLQAHAPTFGFIIRYPEGQESVTGYMYEPWHLRYVGVDAARAIAERYGTLEAYLAARPPEREVSAPAERRADGSAEPQAAGTAGFQGGPPERGGSGPPERPAEGPPARPAEGPPATGPAAPVSDPAAP